MSRIHDAMRKAEEERQFERETPASLENGTLETTDLFATPNEIEEEAFPAFAPQRAVSDPVAPGLPILATNSDSTEHSGGSGPASIAVESVRHSDVPTAKTVTHGLTAECMEQFRTLRTRLNQARSLRPLKRLLISSALPGEGKTFMAARLAQILAQQKDCRVLVIDGDLRCGTLHEQMDIAAGPGVTDFLQGTHDENSVMYRSVYDGVYVMPCGAQVSRSAELLTSGELRTLLDRLSDSFDWIIVDSPAATLVSDARILAGACDGVVLIIEAGTTPFDLAQKAKSAFEHTPVVGAVLNRSVGDHKKHYDYYRRSLESAPVTT